MKPKEYKQKSMKEKEKTKEDYEIQKARREVYEEKIKKLEKISHMGKEYIIIPMVINMTVILKIIKKKEKGYYILMILELKENIKMITQQENLLHMIKIVILKIKGDTYCMTKTKSTLEDEEIDTNYAKVEAFSKRNSQG